MLLDFATHPDPERHSLGNAENFSLAEFFHAEGCTLQERALSFSHHLQDLITAKQGLLYCREIIGPCQNRTWVRDPNTLQAREMIMLGSNNYLGLTTHPKVRSAAIQAIEDYGTGMGGPPLLNGMSALHKKLEGKLARLKGGNDQEYDTLLFASGFQANLGWINGLIRSEDVLLYDELSHASIYDGIAQLGNNFSTKAQAFRFHHNDCIHLRKLLERFSSKNKKQIYVAVQGVYSMDGDLALLPEIYELCQNFGATLIIDDAHGTGVMGPSGAGTAEYFGLHGKIDLSMGTFSKTFGATGGFLVAKREVIDYLRFFARSYMFSAHLPPSTVATVLAGLEVMEKEPECIEALHFNANYLQKGLSQLGYPVSREAAILPIRIPATIDMRKMNRRIHEEGIFLNSIEYPAVPHNQQRLRVSVMATHTQNDLDDVLSVFKKIKREFDL